MASSRAPRMRRQKKAGENASRPRALPARSIKTALGTSGRRPMRPSESTGAAAGCLAELHGLALPAVKSASSEANWAPALETLRRRQTETNVSTASTAT
eukprot:2554523-Pyramimonas_sp.AAC.1